MIWIWYQDNSSCSFFIHNTFTISLKSIKAILWLHFHQSNSSPERFCINSSQLHIFYRWEKWINVNKNIGAYCSQNARILTCCHIKHMKILLSLLICLNIIVLYCYQRMNIFISGTPLHSRVNPVHFKLAQLEPKDEIDMLNWNCLLEHNINVTQKIRLFHQT